MSEGIVLEIHFFLGSFLGGVFLAAAYDMLRFLRWCLPHSRLCIHMEDLLFGIAGSIYSFRLIYQLNDGKIRGFGLFCMAGGMLLYHTSLSKPLLELLERTIGTFLLKFLKLSKKGLKKITEPFKIKIQKWKQMRCRNEERHENGQESKEKHKTE